MLDVESCEMAIDKFKNIRTTVKIRDCDKRVHLYMPECMELEKNEEPADDSADAMESDNVNEQD
jgi:hypothetical protein